MEEIRDDCINNLVAMLQGTIRAYYARRIYNRLWKHKMSLLVAQRTIRGYMIGKTWLWWFLWLALKPGGTNSKEDLLAKISKFEDIKGGLQKEINALNTKVNQENKAIKNLQETLKKTETSQGSLGREMRKCESRLAQVQDEKADKDAQIKKMKEECLHQEELINKL